MLNQVCICFNKESTKWLTKRRLNYPRLKPRTHVVPFKIKDLDLILKYLYCDGVDLVRGDIIISDSKSSWYDAIFTGTELIRYYNRRVEPKYLDACFDLVKDNVPFDYWDIFEYFHIDLLPYTFQPIKYDLLSNIADCHPSYKNNYVLYTSFTHIKTYLIMLDSDECKRKHLSDGKITSAAMPKMMNLFKKEMTRMVWHIDSDYGPNTLIMTLDY